MPPDRAAREHHRDGQRAAGGRRAQQAQAPRPGAEDVARVDRQQRRRAAEEDGEEIERQQADQQPLAQNERDAREQRGRRHVLAGVRGLRRAHERDECCAQEVERADRGVDGGRAERVEHAAERRADDARGLPRGCHAGDRAWQGRQRHQARQQRRAGGILERAHGAEDREDAEDAVTPEPAAEAAERQGGVAGGLRQLAGDDDEPAIAAVRHLSDDQRQRDGRHELHEADEAEIERAARQRIELPADGDGLHVQREGDQHPRRPEERERGISDSRRAARWEPVEGRACRRMSRAARGSPPADARGAAACARAGRARCRRWRGR